MGFKRQTVYNLIQRYEFSSSPTIGGREDAFEELPLTLSYEVSKPNAPQELVEKVLDGDITSNAEYQKMKAELDEAVKRTELAQFHEKQARESFERVAGASHKNFQKYQEEEDKIYKLEKEAENRPVEVAVQQDDNLLKELERLKSENEQLKNSEPEPTDDGTKTFLLRITMGDFERLTKITEKDILLHDKVMRAKMIRL